MQFHELYTVRSGDTLSQIALRNGYRNFGPITAYPPNQQFFKRRSPNVLRPNDRFFIPWNPNRLGKFITWMESLVEDVITTANKMIKEELADKEELEGFLLKVDTISMIATFFVAVGFLAREGAVVAAEEIPADAEEADAQSEKISIAMAKWFGITHAHLLADLTSMSVDPPDPPRADWKLFTRHALGILSPSYWASAAVALKEGDLGIFLWGSQWISYNATKKIANDAKVEIIKIQAPLRHAQSQLDMPFYKNRA